MREERRLRGLESRLLRRIFGPKRDELGGEWRKVHNEEINDHYSSPNIFRVIKPRRMRWAGHVARMGAGKLHPGFWWGNLRERDYLKHPGVGEDNIKMDLQELGCGGMDWIELAQERDSWQAIVNAVIKLQVP